MADTYNVYEVEIATGLAKFLESREAASPEQAVTWTRFAKWKKLPMDSLARLGRTLKAEKVGSKSDQELAQKVESQKQQPKAPASPAIQSELNFDDLVSGRRSAWLQ